LNSDSRRYGTLVKDEEIFGKLEQAVLDMINRDYTSIFEEFGRVL